MPELFTSSSRIKERENKIFIDYLRNSFGATFIAPYSPRATKEASIALPLKWGDLHDATELPRATIKEALKKDLPHAWGHYWDMAQEVDLFKKV